MKAGLSLQFACHHGFTVLRASVRDAHHGWRRLSGALGHGDEQRATNFGRRRRR
jgi:hypothetical protein